MKKLLIPTFLLATTSCFAMESQLVNDDQIDEIVRQEIFNIDQKIGPLENSIRIQGKKLWADFPQWVKENQKDIENLSLIAQKFKYALTIPCEITEEERMLRKLQKDRKYLTHILDRKKIQKDYQDLFAEILND